MQTDTIDPEIQKIVDEFERQLKGKEADVAALKRNTDAIVSAGESEIELLTRGLDLKFDAEEINEEEYLAAFHKEKENILKNTTEKMDALVAKYEKIYSDLSI